MIVVAKDGRTEGEWDGSESVIIERGRSEEEISRESGEAWRGRGRREGGTRSRFLKSHWDVVEVPAVAIGLMGSYSCPSLDSTTSN